MMLIASDYQFRTEQMRDRENAPETKGAKDVEQTQEPPSIHCEGQVAERICLQRGHRESVE